MWVLGLFWGWASSLGLRRRGADSNAMLLLLPTMLTRGCFFASLVASAVG